MKGLDNPEVDPLTAKRAPLEARRQKLYSLHATLQDEDIRSISDLENKIAEVDIELAKIG